MENENENKVYPGIRQETIYITADLKQFERLEDAQSHIIDMAAEELDRRLKAGIPGKHSQSEIYEIINAIFPDYESVIRMKIFLSKNLMTHG